MNDEVTQEQFYQLLRAKRRANEWRLGGGKHGFRAAQALLPNISKRSKRTPRKGEGKKRLRAYQEKRKQIKQMKNKLDEEFYKLLPDDMYQNDKRTISALCNLILEQERKVVGPLHLIFSERKLTWSDLVDWYEKKWKGAKLPRSDFPAFCWHTYDMILGRATSWTDVRVQHNSVPSSCERWVGRDFWERVHQESDIIWENACDFFCQSTIFQDHNSLLYPHGSKVYFNPPFGQYYHFFKHVWPQFLSGRVTDILLVMFWDKWWGYDNNRPCKWIQKLHKLQNKKVFHFFYSFFRPDGTRFENEKHLVCVHFSNRLE